MNFFSRKHYTSDITNFIEELKRKDPLLESRQKEGRSLLWDKKEAYQNSNEFKEGKISQKPYVYQTSVLEPKN